MNQEYKCPYCGQEEYAKTSSKQGKFNNWEPVIKHLSRCKKVDYTYVVTKEYGPIAIADIANSTAKEIKIKYPKADISSKLQHLRKTGKLATVPNLRITYNNVDIINYIQEFVQEHGKIPAMREFMGKYPSFTTVKKFFGSWNAAIEASGFTPMIQNGYGNNTYGLDGHLYRSISEAYFSDVFLYKKYYYLVEPKYPKPYHKYYDWYIPELGLYIELDGGIRPQVTEEKININKILKRTCLFIPITEIYKYKQLSDFMK